MVINGIARCREISMWILCSPEAACSSGASVLKCSEDGAAAAQRWRSGGLRKAARDPSARSSMPSGLRLGRAVPVSRGFDVPSWRLYMQQL